MKVDDRPVVQASFTRQHCECDMFASFFCTIVHRMMAETSEAESQSEDWLSLLKKTDGHFMGGTIEADDPNGVVAVIEHAGMKGESLGWTRIPVLFSDMLLGEETIIDLVSDGFEELYTSKSEPETPVAIVAGDSRCGWVQSEKWAEQHGAIILWWPLIADQYLTFFNDARGGQTSAIDLWERGRRIGFRHGFSEGFYQAKREMEESKKKE